MKDGRLGEQSVPGATPREERLGSGLQARVPALEITAQLLIEHAGPDVQQLVGT
jgi:hypothetical protein